MMNTMSRQVNAPSIQLNDALLKERRKLEALFAVQTGAGGGDAAERALDERLLQIDSALTRIRIGKHGAREG
ncbi:hypothetical protein [Paenibacillus sp.]|uniref:hypothetical protein n=1 Tax=Paenibacillus sp. TaxID=58172 RepID=UPI0035623EA7